MHEVFVAGVVRPQCEAEGCKKPLKSRGWCSMHYERWRRHGSPEVVLARKPPKQLPSRLADRPSVAAVHQRLRRWLGPARRFLCVVCDQRADEWAYDHAAPDEWIGVKNGRPVPVSADPFHYDPMCRPCHRAMDFTGAHRNLSTGRFE